ncbi:MAG: aminopeptidase P family protein [Planctomycetota bacterium]
MHARTLVSAALAALLASSAAAQDAPFEVLVPHETPDVQTPVGDEARGVPMPTGSLGREVYRERRRALLQHLADTGGGIALIRAADSIGKGDRQNLDFYYLTGIEHEAGAALLLDPTAERFKERLFLKGLDVEDNVWHGERAKLGRAVELGTGIASVRRAGSLPSVLTQRLANSEAKTLVYLGPIVPYTSPVPKTLSIYRDATARVPGSKITLDHRTLPAMRQAKTEAELAIMRRANDITLEGHRAAMRAVRPGMTEFELRLVFERAFQEQGSYHLAYGPICGSGPNSCILHYRAGHRVMQDGELVLCDVGCEVEMYASDITRTFPVNGRFTPRQREVYEVVLRANEAAIAAVRPGVTMREVDDAARSVIESAGYTDDFMHGTSHFVGLYVHDAGLRDQPLVPGTVITIEPGIYLPDEHIGIRIEDQVLVTETGSENLSAALTKSVEGIERLMNAETEPQLSGAE